jgi:5'(3')-deoxyribonucleotidase
MIITCKKYIKEGYSKLWDIPKEDIYVRISESKRLFVEYQRNFHKTRDKLKQMENERQWVKREFHIINISMCITCHLNHILHLKL